MTEQQLAILAFEKRFYRHAASKEQDVKDELGLTPVQYYTRLNSLLDDPDAMQAEPVLVKRLRRIRDSRAASRRAG
ncbi:hypothetical protein CH274_13555 [Rhodococcus sp. 06-418-5]|uniref:DUF3263 domain-containing protein n=1 Tax=Rhodococcus sp. 06-418-5 TaxID=2022507 RepID=UPI000B9BA28E|nr:DUF3263 domain-containing protein [Rhodococcus sp. 06-418-5]OZC80646.1 hypothetical protein CH274_13555 [Rhodococcus sp. 06-418-5]